jgi:uncharacterized protein YjbI with pentapeptide repeats
MSENETAIPEPAPEEWLALLKSGVDSFNEFREAHPDWRPLFPKNSDLRNSKLARVNLKNAYMLGARLRDCELFEADLAGADMLEAHLEGANLVDANLEDASLWWANLDDADLYRAKGRNAQLLNASLRGASLVDADFEGADFRSAKLQGANLSGVRLQKTLLSHADLQSADLRGAHFEGANVMGADFRGSRVNRNSTLLSQRGSFQMCGDNDTADSDCLMQWAQLYKTHGVFQLAGHCYYRARQHYRRERLDGLKYFCPAWLWAKTVNAFETLFLDWSCAYGERPGGVLLWGAIVILLSALIYFTHSQYFIAFDGKPMTPTVVTAVYFSTVTFTTLGFGDYHPDPVPFPDRGWWLPLYVAGEAMTGALLMSLFLVTFARIMIRD